MHHRPLDGHRRRTRSPGGDVLIQYAGKQVCHSADRIARTEYIAEEARARRTREAEYLVQLVKGAFSEALGWKCRVECTRDIGAGRVSGKRIALRQRPKEFSSEIGNAGGQLAELLGRDLQRVHV